MQGCVKLALTILTEVDKTTFLPCGKIKLLFTKIKVSKENTLSYAQAARRSYKNDPIYVGVKISEALQKRENITKGVVLNEIANSYVIFNNDEPELHRRFQQRD